AALTLGLAPAALATDVVPNPGFEQGGCGGSTAVICGWESAKGLMSQDTSNPHSGTASMFLVCDGCGMTNLSARQAFRRSGRATALGSLATATTDPFPWASYQSASTDPNVSCAPIGAGVHAASLWYREQVGDMVRLGARFYQGPDCTGTESDDSFGVQPTVYGGWEQLNGALVAP